MSGIICIIIAIISFVFAMIAIITKDNDLRVIFRILSLFMSISVIIYLFATK